MSKIKTQERDTQMKEDLGRKLTCWNHITLLFVSNIGLSFITENYLQEAKQVQLRVTRLVARLGMTTTDTTLEKARTMVEQVTSSRLFIAIDSTG